MYIGNIEIRKIENKLVDMGFRFADIRFELTDHVANALEETEGTFDYALKHYLHTNKKQLENTYHKLVNRYRLQAYKKFFGNVFSVNNLVACALTASVCILLYNTAGADAFNDTIRYVETVLIALPWLYYAVTNVFARRQIYCASDRLGYGTSGVAFLCWIMFSRLLELSDVYILIYHIAVVNLSVVLLLTVVQLQREYKNRYA